MLLASKHPDAAAELRQASAAEDPLVSTISAEAAKLGLRLRCGVHTGEVELLPDNIRGVAVHIVSRITALASAGEVLLSGTTYELEADSDLRFQDRGSHELKGVTGARQVWALTSNP